MNDGGWFEQQDRILSDINITPLVDVSLVLLIIFMITAPMMVQGADVRLPETRPMDSLPQSQLIVSVAADGTVFINDEQVSLADFEARLSPQVDPGRPVQLHGDTDVPYGTIMTVIEVLRRLEADVGLVIQPIPERR